MAIKTLGLARGAESADYQVPCHHFSKGGAPPSAVTRSTPGWGIISREREKSPCPRGQEGHLHLTAGSLKNQPVFLLAKVWPKFKLTGNTSEEYLNTFTHLALRKPINRHLPPVCALMG